MPVWIITAVYLFVVTYVGPKFMKNRKPYNPTNFMIAYNIGLVILSTYTFIEVSLSAMHTICLAGTCNHNDVVLTSMRRHDVASTSVGCHFDHVSNGVIMTFYEHQCDMCVPFCMGQTAVKRVPVHHPFNGRTETIKFPFSFPGTVGQGHITGCPDMGTCISHPKFKS